MESVQLPSELLRHLMMISTIEDILQWCTSIKSINLICQDDIFWQDKINLDYPDYDGLPYKDSYKETGKLLVWGKYVEEKSSNIWDEWFGDIYTESEETVSLDRILINGKTTFNILAKTDRDEEVDYFFFTKNENQYHINVEFVLRKVTIYDDQEHPIFTGSSDTEWYTLAFNGENLLAGLTKIIKLQS